MADEPQHQIAPHRQNTGGKMGFISDLLTTISIGGKMSEQGADKAGPTISEGLRFFLKSVGLGAGIALIFWLSPYFLNALAEFINALRHG